MLRNSSAQKRESRHSNREHLFALRFFVHTSDSYRLCFGRVRLSNVRGGRGQALEHARVCGRSWLWVNIYPCFPIILETRKEPVSITCRDHACNKHAVYIPAAEDDALHGTKTARYNSNAIVSYRLPSPPLTHEPAGVHTRHRKKAARTFTLQLRHVTGTTAACVTAVKPLIPPPPRPPSRRLEDLRSRASSLKARTADTPQSTRHRGQQTLSPLERRCSAYISMHLLGE